MNRAETLTLWHDPDPAFGRIAAREAVDGFFHDPDLFFSLLTDPKADCNRLFKLARRRFPFLSYRPIDPVYDDSPSEIFSNIEQEFNGFTKALREFLEKSPAGNAELTAATVALRFPAISDEMGLWSRAPHSTVSEEETARQFMIFVTGQCNLRCPYCFSNDIEHTFISLAKLDMIMDWCERENVRRITPCGGEPLIYPHLLHLLHRASTAGMKVYFATNFTLPLPDDQIFSGELVEVLYIHLTEALWQNPELLAVFERNAAEARRRGIRLVARGNIESADTDCDKWLELIDRLKLHELNVALTIPSNDGANTYVGLEAMRAMVPKLEKLMDKTAARGIRFRLAKPVPPCFFSPEKQQLVITDEALRPRCNVSESGCTRNVCLSPAMTVQPCLGINNVEREFTTEASWNEMSAECADSVRMYLAKPLLPQCARCFLFKRRLCQGACLSYKQ